MGSSVAPSASARDLLVRVQGAYDRHRYLDAFCASSSLWSPTTDLSKLSIEELVLGGRLAARLGGFRLSRWLLRTARHREPSAPLVRYFTRHLRYPNENLLEDFRALELKPDLDTSNSELRVSWLVTSAYSWATMRDFDRARDYINRAKAIDVSSAWSLSCESDVHGMMDEWEEALRCAQEAWRIDPGAPFTANSIGNAFMHLGRLQEAAEWTLAATESTQAVEIVQLACWHQCALAETLEERERPAALDVARNLSSRFEELAPLADRESRVAFARARLDIAELSDDREEMEKWAQEVHSPFHRKLLENLRTNPPSQRVRLPFRRVIQKRSECVPTSLGSALAATGVQIPIEKMAAEITFGGTEEWAAADWLRNHGLHVRFFSATAEIVVRLIKSGIGFMVTWDHDEGGHAVAIVGVDEAAGTVIVHDPEGARQTEYLLSAFDEKYSPTGITALAAVTTDRAAELDGLLPEEAEIPAAVHAYSRAQFFNDQSAARSIVKDISEKFPAHSGTKYLRACLSLETGKTSDALNVFRELLAQFPTSALVRLRFMYACRAISNVALLRETLEQIVETGSMPGVQAQQEWIRPNDRYVGEYADILRLSANTRNRAKRLLLSVLRRQWNSAAAWHTLADLLWSEQDRDRALLAYRFGSLLSDSNEHFARVYADALAQCGRLDEGFQWLENRVRRYRSTASAVSTWNTWIGMLEDWGSPERALDACKQALEQHPGSPGLLVWIIPFLARMGDWEAAEKQLRILEQSDSRAMFHEASVAFYRMRGEVGLASQHAELWHKELPRSIAAAGAYLDLLRVIDGPIVAIERAALWMREQPANEELEELFCQQVDSTNASSWRKLRVLIRRVKRNPDDGWAWRELFFSTATIYEMRQNEARRRLAPKIEQFLIECDRTSAEDAASFRAHALWDENCERWDMAVSNYLEAIRREPRHFYAYRRVWEASSRLPAAQRRAIWAEMEPLLLQSAGHLPNAREMTALLSERFGVREAEETVKNWMQQRPNDPNVLEAAADLLVEYGHGRSDAARALALLKPAVERFPFHAGLRFSLANTHRALGEHSEAAQVYRELVRRHPDNTDALIQLAWVQHYDGDSAAALVTLQEAESRAPQNANPILARVQVLRESRRFEEAVQVLQDSLRCHSENVFLLERAINIFGQCGLPELAVEAAREGVRVHLRGNYIWRGAYLWLLLARTLRENPQFAAQGEVEECLRKSLSLNAGLFEAADLLSMFLVEQKRYEPALMLLSAMEGRQSDPSCALGRKAWVMREQGSRKEAVVEIARTMDLFPWYAWGWNLLVSYLEEDRDWTKCQELLDAVPPQMLANVDFRLRRLSILENAGIVTKALDEEWSALLHDFPEDVRLHVRRYDNLVSKERFQEASEVIETILPTAPDNSFVLARVTEVRCREHKTEEALDAAMRVCFAEVEESTWPVDKVWDTLNSQGFGGELYDRFKKRLDEGDRPTRRALSAAAIYLMDRFDVKRLTQDFLTNWFPRRGARRVLGLLKIVNGSSWGDDRYRADLFSTLVDYGYQSIVVRRWRALHGRELSIELWSQIGRALVGAGKKRSGKKFFADWRDRVGVEMWMVTNLLICFNRNSKKELGEIVRNCQDALTKLPHDHCARYLTYMLAEAQVLLKDKQGLLKTWQDFQPYFDGELRSGEYFKTEERYLLGDIPMLVRYVQQNLNWFYWKKAFALRIRRFVQVNVD